MTLTGQKQANQIKSKKAELKIKTIHKSLPKADNFKLLHALRPKTQQFNIKLKPKSKTKQ